MAQLSTGFPGLNPDTVQLYYTTDPLMESLPVLILYGPSTTGNATRSSSRIQAHIYALAGFQSYPRLTIAPTSPLYAAVNHLPSDRQGDEVSRGLAISLLSYFAGLTGPVKDRLKVLAARRRPNRLAPAMFDEMHAGQLAAEMVKINGAAEMIQCLSNALSQQSLSWIDVDVVLPPKTIQRAVIQDGTELIPACGDDGLPLFQYGQYGPLINQIGHPAFLPTSKLKRAPSRPAAHSKSKILSKDQKVLIRRELCEILDTEKSYVVKLQHLTDDVAMKFRQSLHEDIQRRTLRIGDDPVARLFPESLSRIVTANSEFLQELEEVLSATEDAAIQDIEGLAEGVAKSELDRISIASWKRDPTGTLAFAKVLLKWLPKFSGPYQDYMRTSVDLPKALCAVREDGVSELCRVVNEFGEQRLRSALIEPVQRLPRYSLLLDNIISQLPASHPAMSSLLKSKDVVADICALESCSSADTSRTSTLVRKYVRDWPSWLSPRGRLTTAVDAVELDPPYGDHSSGLEVLVLLFPDTLIIARKENGNASLGAKGILAEVDRPTMNPTQYHADDIGLIFSAGFDLSKLLVSEFANDRAVRLMYTITAPSQIQNNLVSLASNDVQVKVLSMLGPYEGRAHRFSEDIIKARIEGRFSEPIRDSDKWALRTMEMTPGSIGMYVATYQQDSITQAGAVLVPPRIRIEIGIQGDSERSNLKDGRVEITSRITPLGSDAFRIDVQGFDGSRSSETSTIESLGRIMVRKFMQTLNVQAFSQSHLWATSDVSYNHNVLRKLPILPPSDGSPVRSFRPLSPIKLVSHLFGGSTSQASTPYKPRDQAPKLKEVPPIPPPKSVCHVSEDRARPPPSDQLTVIGGNGDSAPDPLAGLELTLDAYIVALRSRSGNIVGKILRNRAAADELLVNELYNTLIEDPSRLKAAAEVSVDVLFAAFEKFLDKAWQERMGSLLTPDLVATMISGFESRRPIDFSQQVRKCLENMSPQNRRAFSAAVKLLSDLLEASGNDGDRGALMATFTEILVPSSNSHDCITLFDRLVDDYETLFDDNPLDINGNPDAGSTSNHSRNERSNNTGSWSSNASSLKKRFGFGGLSRENSKSEPESKVASVWRTLSKNARSPGDGQQQPASLSKGSLLRSKSTDLDVRMLPPIRPASRDKQTPPNASPRDTSHSRPTSSHLNMSIMSTIGESSPTKVPSLMKKKRRSSLSDLKSAQQPAEPWLPLQPRKLPQPGLVPGTPPRTPSSNRQNHRYTPSVDYSQRFGSPERFGSQRRHSPQRFGSPQNKENSPGPTVPVRKEGSPSLPRYNYKKPLTSIEANEVKITSFSPKKRTPSSSGISATRGGHSERTRPPNVPAQNPPTKPTQSSPQKLRIQSPQKLRERLSNEQKVLNGAESSLQAEIAKIGEEMSVFKLSRPDSKKARPSPDPFATTDASTAASLDSRLVSLSTSLNELASDLRTRHSSLSKDMESSLLVHERKSRKLDELYKEANAENEALYDRFNDELGKILSRVKGGAGIEELKKKVQDGEQEQQRLRKENARLKREVVGLKSQLG